MKACVKFALTLVIAAALTLAFRALAFTVCTVRGSALQPEFIAGDRILVNRWSYGLRTGRMGGLFRYGRLCRSEVRRGDIVAFDSPTDSLPGVFVARCRAVPGDTLNAADGPMIVPGAVTCADQEYYLMETVGGTGKSAARPLGLVPESSIIGRVCMIVYSHDDTYPVYDGYVRGRTMIIK